MKVLVVSNLYPPDYIGGLELSAQKTVDGLRSRGYEVDVLTRRPPEGAEVPPEPHVHRLLCFTPEIADEELRRRHPRMHGWWPLYLRLRAARPNLPIVRRFLEDRPYDVAMFFGMQSIGPALFHRFDRAGIPVLWNMGDYFMLEQKKIEAASRLAQWNLSVFSRRWYRLFRSIRYDYVSFNSHFLESRYKESGFPMRHSFVIHRGIDFPVTPADELRLPRDPIFLIACQLERHKGIHVAIEAASMLRERPWSLRIIGDGPEPYGTEVRQRVLDLGLEDRIEFLGRRPHAEVIAQMRAAVAFINPPIWDEPFGRTSIEAMACGAPLINSDSGAIREIAEDEVSALIYPKEDAGALADRMARILDDPSLRLSLARAGAQRVQEAFTIDAVLDKTESVLAEVARLAKA
ncbi:MAG TPA: glycosyltransferase family 4 protein [Fimbriimonadaceae bacterium]|nr:glycosyltransferase family 4 protein [Fimbriimonadaceae bacterium]HRJ95516.1 glycosyltransferase family 4 protein [Fimbriimonadaceae bacterium]